MTDNVYSMIYERDGIQYEMLVIAGVDEADFIADSLGLEKPVQIATATQIHVNRSLN
jgi:hypothetical protein